MILRCKKCGIEITSELTQLTDEGSLRYEDGKEMIERGMFFISSGEYQPERNGDFIVNLKDLINSKLTDNGSRLNGCCGLDGLDGMNLLCVNGHEIGTERSDCWMSHHAVISTENANTA